MMDFSKSKFDIVGKAKIWYIISGCFILLGLIGIGINLGREGFPLKRGIDFTGGSIIQLQFDNWDGSKNRGKFAEDVKNIIARYTELTPAVQNTIISENETKTGQPALLLHLRTDASLIENPRAQEEMYDKIREYGGVFTVLEETEVGAIMGRELTIKAIQGVTVGLLLILLYITIRLSFDFGVFAVIALFHDLIILIGIFALFGIEINSSFVAILLTVVGYSINDTIIIYDRIRESMKTKRHLPFNKLVNQSLLETMARSINTSGTTLLAILAILIFGGESLRTFMLGLGVGILTGTYSSIFVASILLVHWRMKGRGTVFAEERAPSVTSIILDENGEPEEIEEDIEYEEVEQITLDSTPSVRKTTSPRKPKRRKRRH
ncbi:MAG TPA: protein translocase subunit SecF [Firmicutes bacterium]|nr:protein translocase subunit SecF [Bacillota bacterium]